jgi:hypothetical protein
MLTREKPDGKDSGGNSWMVIKELSRYLWPAAESGVKVRVLAAVGLLIGGKVLDRRSI